MMRCLTTRRPRALVSAAALALACAACAPPVPPRQAPPPPSDVPASDVPTPGGPEPVVPQAFRLDAEPVVDVGLAWDLKSVKITPVRSQERLLVVGNAGKSLDARGPFEARLTSGGWEIEFARAGAKSVTHLGVGDTLFVGDGRWPAGERPADPVATWDGKTWRGQLKVFVGPRGLLTIAARLPIETYLLGVVPGEIGALAENLIEAGRAQAIAARSYTLFYRGRRAAEGFDLYATVEDQVYGPTEGERPLATRCVQGTRGLLALGDDAPIRANYYSTCGGITADVWEAWPAVSLSYLKGRRDADEGADFCAGSRYHRWREQWSAREFADGLTRFAPPEGVSLPPGGVGTIRDVRVVARSRSGRVWRLEVTTTTGTIAIHAHVLRRVLRRPGPDAGTLRSNLFKIGVHRDPGSLDVVTIVAAGAGFGHGVGLCQTGALGMARVGRSGEQILLHYYPGIEIRRMY